MKKYFIGIDVGSTMCKSVLFDGNNIVDTLSIKTGWNSKLSAKESFETLLRINEISKDNIIVSATGYGREAVNFADYIFTEITCHAFGGIFMSPGIQGIIDIGGQDSKVIQIKNGKVSNFLMNDKCAAGTGRFLNMACDTLEINLNDIDMFTSIDNAVPINSMCAVFAESEIIGLLALQKDRSEIMAGVLRSIAKKIVQLTSKLNFDSGKPLLITGGLSKSGALIKILSETVGYDVFAHELSVFAGAAGACVLAEKKLRGSVGI